MVHFRLGSCMLWLVMLAGGACAPEEKVENSEPEAQSQWVEHSLQVTATAYNSVPEQTDDNPTEAAWGDQLEPGMKVIAVSRDLIPLGLKHRAVVTIEGFTGEYLVLDKMAARWKKRIDIYMGLDVKAALQWGKRPVVIHWKTKRKDETKPLAKAQ